MEGLFKHSHAKTIGGDSIGRDIRGRTFFALFFCSGQEFQDVSVEDLQDGRQKAGEPSQFEII